MKKLLIAVQMFILAVLLPACATMVVNSSSSKLNKSASYLVIPFKNYIQTTDAGARVASMLDGIMLSRNYGVLNASKATINYGGAKEENISKILGRANGKGIRYVIAGSVNEFRYKTGIEGEPAVSVTIFVYDSASGRIIWSGTGSATGWSNQSRTTVAQGLLIRLLHF